MGILGRLSVNLTFSLGGGYSYLGAYLTLAAFFPAFGILIQLYNSILLTPRHAHSNMPTNYNHKNIQNV